MRKYLWGIGAAAIAALVAGCGDTDATHQPGEISAPATTAGANQADRNDQDIAFAQGMIPHHQQAIDMALLAAERATSAEVKDLAGRVQDAQDPEIEQLTGLLERWGAPAESGMDHGDMSHEGMMTDEEMGQLETATGPDFDRTWVRLMIRHHEGAVAMATAQLSGGANAEAKELAQRIIDAQQAEIVEMRGLTL